MSFRRTNWIAALWGLLEATVFFVVPDVLLTGIATRSAHRALVACCCALAGALLGGVVMYVAAHLAPQFTRDLIATIPAINAALMADVQQQLQADGLRALFCGPLTGTPYKIYAAESGALNLHLPGFVAVSAPARMARFVFLVLLSAAISRALQRRVTLRAAQWTLMTCWAVFYVWYFRVTPG